MKRLWDVLVLTLAMNFVLLAAAIGWMYQSGHLDRERVKQVKELIFPADLKGGATTQPTTQPATRPSQLDDLLARHTGFSAAQQVDFVRQTFDTQAAEMDHRSRELNDLKNQVDLANAKLAADRATLEADKKKFADQQAAAQKSAADQGFAESLSLYNSMPARQVKTIFMSLSDDAVIQYLQAMDSSTAAKVLKEFKAPEETQRAQRILEKMRTGQTTAGAGSQ